MPGLVAFGRRWMAATDELVIPFGTVVVFRLAWLLLISIIFGIYAEILQTDPSSTTPEIVCKSKVNIYLIGYIVLLIIIAIMDALISFSSSRGTVFELHKRTAVVPLLYVRAGLFIIELTWQILGFVWIFSSSVRHNCYSMPTKTLAQGVVIFNLLFMVGSLVPIYFFFDSAGHLWQKLHSAKDKGSAYGAINKEIRDKYERKWEKSCKALFCCSKVESSQENVFGFVSRLLSEYFQEYLDLVPSDFVAGLILLRRHQKFLESQRIATFLDEGSACKEGCKDVAEVIVKRGEKFVHRHQKTKSAKAFNYQNLSESKLFEDITHYSSYALAVYGWPFYLYDRILCGACTLCCKVRCCASCCGPSKKEFTLVEDNCCECNIEATKLFLNEHEHELIYVSYKDEVYQPPFFVAVDHKKRSVVISCRGTLSLKDVLTDVMVEEARIPVENAEPNMMGHKGMIESAQFVLDIIKKEELLERAFNSDSSRGSQSYDLTIVGHSLGAGVASILAFLLRPKYPKLTCFAYSAVGATFNYAASKHAQDFIYSIVVGKDVISRLNLHTLDELRYMIIELLQRTNLPKATSKNSHEDYLDHEFHDIPPYEPESSKRYYMGGKVVHIVKTHSIYPKWLGKKKALYEAVWADVEDFQSILISNLMWKDHIPDTVKGALSSCLGHVEVPRKNGSAKECDKSKGNSNGVSKDSKSDEEEHLLGENLEETSAKDDGEVKIDIVDTTTITLTAEDGKQQSEEVRSAEKKVKNEEVDSCEILINLNEEDAKHAEEEQQCSEEKDKVEEDAKPVEYVIKTAGSTEIVDVIVEETKVTKSSEVLIEVREETVEEIGKPSTPVTSIGDGINAGGSMEFVEIVFEKESDCEEQQKLEGDSKENEDAEREEADGKQKESCNAVDQHEESKSDKEEGLSKSESMGFVEIVLVHNESSKETADELPAAKLSDNEKQKDAEIKESVASIEVASTVSETQTKDANDLPVVHKHAEIVEQIQVAASSLEESLPTEMPAANVEESTATVVDVTMTVTREEVVEETPLSDAVSVEEKNACKEHNHEALAQEITGVPESSNQVPADELNEINASVDLCVSSSVELKVSEEAPLTIQTTTTEAMPSDDSSLVSCEISAAEQNISTEIVIPEENEPSGDFFVVPDETKISEPSSSEEIAAQENFEPEILGETIELKSSQIAVQIDEANSSDIVTSHSEPPVPVEQLPEVEVLLEDAKPPVEASAVSTEPATDLLVEVTPPSVQIKPSFEVVVDSNESSAQETNILEEGQSPDAIIPSDNLKASEETPSLENSKIVVDATAVSSESELSLEVQSSSETKSSDDCSVVVTQSLIPEQNLPEEVPPQEEIKQSDDVPAHSSEPSSSALPNSTFPSSSEEKLSDESPSSDGIELPDSGKHAAQEPKVSDEVLLPEETQPLVDVHSKPCPEEESSNKAAPSEEQPAADICKESLSISEDATNEANLDVDVVKGDSADLNECEDTVTDDTVNGAADESDFVIVEEVIVQTGNSEVHDASQNVAVTITTVTEEVVIETE
eukprot:gene5103-221_t